MASPDTVQEIRDLTAGGAHVTMDALGSNDIVQQALQSSAPAAATSRSASSPPAST